MGAVGGHCPKKLGGEATPPPPKNKQKIGRGDEAKKKIVGPTRGYLSRPLFTAQAVNVADIKDLKK